MDFTTIADTEPHPVAVSQMLRACVTEERCRKAMNRVLPVESAKIGAIRHSISVESGT
jgi:hypothetical protein